MNDPAATLALCSWLKKRVAEWEADAKAALELETGERKAAKVGGAVIGYTNKVRGRKRLRVINETGFVQWVFRRWPDETVQTRSVGEAFRKKLEQQALNLGALIDDEGEVCPHVEIVEGEPFLSTKLTESADDAVAGLLSRGALGPHGLKAIEGADK